MRTPWTINDRTPQQYPAPGFDAPGVRSLFYDGPSYKGKPTRVFAWMGVPHGASKEKPVPGIVLIHGGGGSAFAHWVKMWVDRGYAAIAMDTCGHTPDHGGKRRDQHAMGGPAGWGAYETIHQNPEDQWTFHAIEAVIRAHNILRALPNVRRDCIGVTGISWGGFLTSIVAGVDSRFRYAMPVYGCGFIGDSPGLGLDKAPREIRDKWMKLWDPSVYLANAKMPMLWMNGATDFAFTPPMWQQSHDLTRGEKTLAFMPFMPHGHTQGEVPKELHRYADFHAFRKARLGRCVSFKVETDFLDARFTNVHPDALFTLSFTQADNKPWPQRTWTNLELGRLPRGGRVRARVPNGVLGAFIHCREPDGCVVSSPCAGLG